MRGAATAGDFDRARAFFVAWDLAPVQRVYEDGVTRIPLGTAHVDAVHAFAQALADEREAAELLAVRLGDALEASNARLRATIGICSDIGKLMPQIASALDEYAKPPPRVVPCGGVVRGPVPEGVSRACGLPHGHRGPCGASR